MPINLIATDLDGTLLAPDHITITPRTLSALTSAHQKGVKIAISTGRTLSLIKNVAEKLPFVDYIIYSNGAGVYDCRKKATVFVETVKKDKSEAITTLLDNLGVYYNIYADGNIYISSELDSRVFEKVDLPKDFLNQFLSTAVAVNDIKTATSDKATEMIVVIANGNVSHGGYNRKGMEPFIAEMTENIIPYIEENYRVSTKQSDRAIAGLSMGGGQSFYAGLQNTQLFSAVGIFSSGIFGGIASANAFDAEKEIPGLLSNPESFNKALQLFYISVGEQDPRIEPTKRQIAVFKEKGLDVTFATFPGDHEWQVWRKSLHDFASRLFK